MPKHAARILHYRRCGRLEVLLVHPGGPFWARKDDGAWSIPKGEFDDEEPVEAAKREFREETGCDLALDRLEPLGTLRQAGGKVVHAWAAEGECDAGAVRSNTFTMEWPPGSGLTREFPEVDRAAWFGLDEARRKRGRTVRPLEPTHVPWMARVGIVRRLRGT